MPSRFCSHDFEYTTFGGPRRHIPTISDTGIAPITLNSSVADKMKELLIPISPGELLDKITILQIKAERIRNEDKLINVQKELNILNGIWSQAVSDDHTIDQLKEELITINKSLWDIEDDIRNEEKHQNFGERFIELARSVYITNDRRADVKKKINIHLGSKIVEEKSYQDYS